MEKLRNVFDYLSWRSSLVLSLEEALKDSSIPDSTFSLKKVDLTSRLKVANKRAHGGSADVYVGQLRMAGSKAEPRTVAVKVSRLHVQSDDTSKIHSFARELRIWTDLKHRNVLPCLGFAEYNNSLVLVSDWMENGNLIQFLSSNADAHRLEMARGIVYGLEYLHQHGIVHSDLKGANILIDSEGEPMLSDFGISRLVRDGVTVTGTNAFKFSINWMAIELVIPSDTSGSVGPDRSHTMKSDIWALGMVFYEILALKIPFHGFNEFLIPYLIASGQLPEKPVWEQYPGQSLDNIWNMCTQCWEKIPESRPTATEIALKLGMQIELSEIREFKVPLGWLKCVAFSPVDSQSLVTASYEHDVCVWELSEDGKLANLRQQLTGHTDGINSVTWSRDGLYLVSSSVDKTIRKWNASTGECQSMIVTRGRVNAAALSPDNKHIASCGFNNSVYVWNATSGDRVLGPLRRHTNYVRTVIYSPDGWYILSGSADNTVIVWDSITGLILFGPFTSHSDRIRSISFHPLGERFVTGSSDNTFTIWDAKSFQPIYENLRVHNGWLSSVQYSPDGRFILSASDDGTLTVWDAKKGRVASSPVKNGCSVWTASFSPDGRWIVSGDSNGMAKIWEVRVYNI